MGREGMTQTVGRIVPRAPRSGEVPMPSDGEASVGEHSALLVGYDQKTSRFIARNSYGRDWGDRGYFTIPFDYVLSPRAENFWTMQAAS